MYAHPGSVENEPNSAVAAENVFRHVVLCTEIRPVSTIWKHAMLYCMRVHAMWDACMAPAAKSLFDFESARQRTHLVSEMRCHPQNIPQYCTVHEYTNTHSTEYAQELLLSALGLWTGYTGETNKSPAAVVARNRTHSGRARKEYNPPAVTIWMATQ